MKNLPEYQFFFHLIGDYITQTSWMAVNKVKSWLAAVTHAFVYSAPFAMLGSWQAWAVIFGTHAIIDRFSLAKYVIYAKNAVTDKRYWPINQDSKSTDFSTPFGEQFTAYGECYYRESCMANFGYDPKTPQHISFLCYVVADNTLHLIINYLALKYL